ncbi:hypothetical protein [Ensifer sp. BR816]|uniref:hypothetical protein n=1 Tax=Rhizobium sp. (strain BR816) TaxID=1057002 RepID=UPI000368C426|nr:hypothetical protein [Ensifer sp. BR816]
MIQVGTIRIGSARTSSVSGAHWVLASRSVPTLVALSILAIGLYLFLGLPGSHPLTNPHPDRPAA